MKNVFARVLATAVLMSAALFFLTATSVYAKSGPGNPGHHYGQKKHQKSQPPSGPSPSARFTTSSGTDARGPEALPSLPNVTVKIPSLRLTGRLALRQSDPGGGLEWLAVLILPLLLAVWVLVFSRALVMARGRLAGAAVARTSPAT